MEFINVFSELFKKCSSDQIKEVPFVVNEFIKICKKEEDSMKVYQLNFLLTYTSKENFLVTIFSAYKKKYNIMHSISKVMDTFEEDQISPMVYSYFLYCILKALSIEVRDFSWINPTKNTLVNETMNLETGFGVGCYLETLDDYEIEDKKLIRVNTNRKYLTVPYGIESVDRSAFDDLLNLEFVTFPETIVNLTEGNFNNKVSVSRVLLSNKVKRIPADFFKNAQNLYFVSGRGVRVIESNAFEATRISNLKSLAGVRIERLGDYAFRDCFQLKKINLPYLQKSGLSPFYNCMNVTDLSIDINLKMIDNNVKIVDLFDSESKDLSNYPYFNNVIVNAKDGIIPDGFFEGCTSITNIKINGNITKVGSNIFKGCSSLTTLEMNFVGDTLGDSMFDGCISLENFPKFTNVEHIGANTFKGCTKLEELSFPKPILSLSEGSFRDCNILRKLNVKLITKELPSYVFSKCISLIDLKFLNDICVFKSYCLKDIVLPTNFSFNKEIEYIGANAFDSTTFNNVITIPKNCTIDKLAFSNIPVVQSLICNNLEIKDINNNNVELFELFESDKQLFLFKFSTLKNITIDTNVIGDNSFNKWHQIEQITLSSKVDIIGESSFEECVNLKHLVLSNTLINIKKNAFKNCNALLSITTPNNNNIVNGVYDLSTALVIEEGAFFNCNCSDVHLEIQQDSSVNSISLGSVFAKDFKTNLTLTNIYVNVIGTTLPVGLFDGCSTAKSIKISGVISTLSENLFKDCSSIDSLNLEFSGNIITKGCFENCTNLKEIPSFNNVDTIEDNAFKNCKSLPAVSFEKHISYLGESAFEGCSSLCAMNFELHSKKLKANSFKDCNNIPDYFFIKEVEVFESFSLSELNLVNKFNPPHNAKRVCANAISGSTFNSELILRDNIIYEKEAFNNSKGITKVTFENVIFKDDTSEFAPVHLFASSLDEFNKKYNINSICINTNKIINSAFMGWKHLVNVDLTTEVKKLPESCFENCNLINTIVFPYYNISLSSNVFANCINLNKIEYLDNYLEENVDSIPQNVFKNCKKITEVTVYLDQFILDSKINFFAYFDESEILFNKHFAKLRVVNVVNKISEIPNYFFSNCKKVSTINFINDVNNFGAGTFNNCHSLMNINVNYTGNVLEDNLFSNCYKLANLFDYKTVDSIGSMTFSGCKKLPSLSFDKQIISIKTNAFENCVSLNEISLEYVGEVLEAEVFLNCKKLNSSPKLLNLKSIKSSAFNGCKKMKELHISGFTNDDMNGVFGKNKSITNIYFYGEIIPSKFFFNFNNNTVLHFDKPIKRIEDNAFEGCLLLKSFANLEQIEEIGNEAFKNSGLIDITIPSTINNFGSNLFDGCTNLVCIDVPIRFDFIGTLFGKEESEKSRLLLQKSFGIERSYYIPQSLKTIKINSGELLEGSFSNVDLELIINVKLNRIKDYTFYNCTNLSLPYIDEIRQIGDYAFAHTTIDNLNLNNVVSIGHSSFKDCSVKNIVIGSKISEINATSFTGLKFDDFKIEKNIFYKFETNILIDVKKTIILTVFDCDFDLVIPSEIQTLESNTFDSINIKNINTNNVKVIKSNAFSNCLTLENVTMPKVEKYNQNVFLNCPNIKDLNVSFLGIEKIIPKYLDYLFDVVPTEFNNVTVNNGTITMNAFRNINLIKELNLLNVKQEVFEDNTFRNIQINKLILPKTLNDLTDNAFANVIIDDVVTNEKIKYESNCIIINSKLMYCTKANLDSLIINEEINYISKSAFKLVDQITNVELYNRRIDYLELFDGIRGVKKITTCNINNQLSSVFKRVINDVEEIIFTDNNINPQFFKGINEFKKLVFTNLNTFELENLTNPLTALRAKKILINNLIFTCELNFIKEEVFEFIDVQNFEIVNNENYFMENNVLYNKSTNTLVYASKNVSGEIIAPTNITIIKNEAFSNCINLRSVSLLDAITLGDNLFFGCSSLNTVIINSNCESIGKSIFKDCNNFKLINIPFIGEKPSSISNLTYLFGKDAFDVSIKELKLTNHESINKTFNNFTNINKIILGNNTTTINVNSFDNCTKLSELYLSPSITALPDYVFINAPKSLKVIVDKDVLNTLGLNWSKFGEDKKLGGVKVVAKKSKPELFI